MIHEKVPPFGLALFRNSTLPLVGHLLTFSDSLYSLFSTGHFWLDVILSGFPRLADHFKQDSRREMTIFGEIPAKNLSFQAEMEILQSPRTLSE